MKKQKANQIGRTVLKQFQAAKLPAHKKRALHVHIALHPMSVLVLLCMGVLLVSFTLNAVADSYLVTAIVPAPPLTQPAIIVSPTNGVVTGTQVIAVGGTCPAGSYVDLFDNSRFVGAAVCNSGTFTIGVDLVQGSNQLQAQDYNITNSPGPASAAVSVMYVPGAPEQSGSSSVPQAIVTIGQLVVTQVDTGVPYQPTSTMTVSIHPTFAGIAPPLSRVVVTVNPGKNCTATANAQGYWKCTASGLAAGQHTVSVAGTTPLDGQLVFSAFSITAQPDYIPVAPPLTPLILSSSYSYTTYIVGQTVTYTVSISGGQVPYAMVVSWGDGGVDLSLRQSAGTFTFTHTYGWIKAPRATKTVLVEAIDTAGQSAMLQLDTVVRNPAYSGAIANITRTTGLWGVFNALRPWLWLLWPGYLIVLLLVFSFWLGEHQEMIQVRKKRRLAAMRGKRRRTPAHR